VARFARGSAPWLALPAVAALVAVAWWGQTRSDAVLAEGAPLGLVADWALWLGAFALLVELFFIDRIQDPDLGPVDRLSIFMSPKDVHVNRFPLDGKVVSVTHHKGGHIPAWSKDSERNERVVTVLDTDLGRVKVIQIAGTLARRIVPYIQGGETAIKGDRMGLIRLGSRCDLLVPPGSIQWTVHLGQQVHAGSTQVGEPA
jgi:phosphatidylserine decarboxylase